MKEDDERFARMRAQKISHEKYLDTSRSAIRFKEGFCPLGCPHYDLNRPGDQPKCDCFHIDKDGKRYGKCIFIKGGE